jgi:hypothetical protein
MDPRTYRQEFEGSFETFEGRAYYGFGPANVRELQYDPHLDLIFCFDFNVSPGVAVVVQEQVAGTCVIGEVWIEEHSNTPKVCADLAYDWADVHEGNIICRGDQTGGAQSTSGVEGSDWDLIQMHLGRSFKGEIEVDLPGRNPPEKDRVNAMNTRIAAVDGTRRLFVDGNKAPHTMKDLDSVEADTRGRLMKPKAKGQLVKPTTGPGRMLTHLTDALGYHVWRTHPVEAEGGVVITQM